MGVSPLQRRIFQSSVLGFILFAVSAVFIGCRTSALTPRTYMATIERVEEMPGDYYSPRKGQTPLVCLLLRMSATTEERRPEMIRVFLMGVYVPSLHGERGDSVSFSYSHPLPMSGEISFDSFTDYRLLRRRQNASEPKADLNPNFGSTPSENGNVIFESRSSRG